MSMKFAPKHIALLGSTGSIGTQTLDVVAQFPESFKIEILTAHSNIKLLAQQAIRFRVPQVVIADESKYSELCQLLQAHEIKVAAGVKAIEDSVKSDQIDWVINALVGFAGFVPTVNAIKAGKHLALANKESLVVGGKLINRLLEQNGSSLIPIDSEHSAIFQCLMGEEHNPIECIYLTASGGPFRGYTAEQLHTVTPQAALKHPNWEMGQKITIDSASLVNKGLEMIEAQWLFHLKPEQIKVIVHPQSIVHSLVQFQDSSIKAQLGLPDMRLPIQLALTYPERWPSNLERFDFLNYPALFFEAPDYENFPALRLAEQAMQRGGNIPAVLNAANEVAVHAFLKGKIGFRKITDLIEHCMENAVYLTDPTVEDYCQTHYDTLYLARDIIG